MAGFTPIVICNLALAHIGIGNRIASLDERSSEASVCNLFYPVALDEILIEFPWPMATKFKTLELVEEDPTSEWAFSYRYPSDCLDVHRILSGIRNDHRQSRIPFKIGADSEGSLIYTDSVNAEIEYTAHLEDTTRFSADFVMAFSYLLASYMVNSFTGSDRFKIAEQMKMMYERKLSAAMAGAANEEQPDDLPQSEMIRAREDGSDIMTMGSRFESV